MANTKKSSKWLPSGTVFHITKPFSAVWTDRNGNRNFSEYTAGTPAVITGHKRSGYFREWFYTLEMPDGHIELWEAEKIHQAIAPHLPTKLDGLAPRYYPVNHLG